MILVSWLENERSWEVSEVLVGEDWKIYVWRGFNKTSCDYTITAIPGGRIDLRHYDRSKGSFVGRAQLLFADPDLFVKLKVFLNIKGD